MLNACRSDKYSFPSCGLAGSTVCARANCGLGAWGRALVRAAIPSADEICCASANGSAANIVEAQMAARPKHKAQRRVVEYCTRPIIQQSFRDLYWSCCAWLPSGAPFPSPAAGPIKIAKGLLDD